MSMSCCCCCCRRRRRQSRSRWSGRRRWWCKRVSAHMLLHYEYNAFFMGQLPLTRKFNSFHSLRTWLNSIRGTQKHILCFRCSLQYDFFFRIYGAVYFGCDCLSNGIYIITKEPTHSHKKDWNSIFFRFIFYAIMKRVAFIIWHFTLSC